MTHNDSQVEAASPTDEQIHAKWSELCTNGQLTSWNDKVRLMIRHFALSALAAGPEEAPAGYVSPAAIRNMQLGIQSATMVTKAESSDGDVPVYLRSALAAGKVEATSARGSYTPMELREIAELPDQAIAAAFRDVAARNYSTCYASLFRAHVMEKARRIASPSPLSADPESAVVGAAKEPQNELERLRAFFREVAELTKDHDVLQGPGGDEDDHAVVYPRKLGEALERVDRNWHGWGVAEIASPTLPHPALDRANAGERESEGVQEQQQENDRG